MYSATFVFRVKAYDESFRRLNDLVDQAARSNPGFIRKESWMEPEGDRRAAVYYWTSREALERFSKHPDHVEAKRRYAEWYHDYEVVVAEVIRVSRGGDSATL